MMMIMTMILLMQSIAILLEKFSKYSDLLEENRAIVIDYAIFKKF